MTRDNDYEITAKFKIKADSEWRAVDKFHKMTRHVFERIKLEEVKKLEGTDGRDW